MGPRTRRGVLVTALGLAALLVLGLDTPVADTSRSVVSLTPRAALAPTPGDQFSPAVASNGSEFLVVWEDRRNGIDETDIYASRVAADGTTLDPDGIAIATADGLEWTPEVASDGTNFLVVWTDGVQVNRGDVRAARVTPQGEVLDPGGLSSPAPSSTAGIAHTRPSTARTTSSPTRTATAFAAFGSRRTARSSTQAGSRSRTCPAT